MRKEVFILCDPDKDYISGFVSYLTRRNLLPFEIMAFTGSDTLLSYARGKQIDLLLIHPDLFTREVKELSAATTVLLTDAFLPAEAESYPCVNKFQACSEVIRQTLGYYTEDSPSKYRKIAIKRKTEILGVFSPVGRCGKTTFSLTLAQVLGKSARTLYVNLESYSGFHSLAGSPADTSLSDLLYWCTRKDKPEQGSLLHRLAGTVKRAGNIDYIPPVSLPWDIRCATSEGILEFLNILTEESGYEIILLDIGNEVEDVLHVLERCTRIIMPVLRDRISQAKIRQFEEALKEWGAEAVLKRIERIRPPLCIPEGTGTALLEQLESGKVGAYVRNFCDKSSPDS